MVINLENIALKIIIICGFHDVMVVIKERIRENIKNFCNVRQYILESMNHVND